MKRKRDRRVFWLSLGFTLFLLTTALGLAAVDWQGRSLSFGDTAPPVLLVDKQGGGKEMEIRLFGVEDRVDVTKWWNFFIFLCDFGCIPHK